MSTLVKTGLCLGQVLEDWVVVLSIPLNIYPWAIWTPNVTQMIITTSPEYNVIYTARKTQGLHTCNYLKSEWKTIETIPAPTQAPIKTNLFHLTFSSSKNHLKVTQVSSSQPVFPQQSHLKFPWELQLKVLTHTLCQERGSRSVFSRAPASCYHWYNYLQNGKTRIQRQSHSFKVTLFRSGLSDFRTGSAVTSLFFPWPGLIFFQHETGDTVQDPCQHL